MKHPQWIIKFVHKSKVSAVKIVDWDDHHEIATIPHAFTFDGEDSDGMKDAKLMVKSPELLEAARLVIARVDGTNINTPINDMSDTWAILRDAVKAIEEA